MTLVLKTSDESNVKMITQERIAGKLGDGPTSSLISQKFRYLLWCFTRHRSRKLLLLGNALELPHVSAENEILTNSFFEIANIFYVC